jgi:heat shock protein HslJ
MSLRKLSFLGIIAILALVISACAPGATAGQGGTGATLVASPAAETPTEAAVATATSAATAEISGTAAVSPTVSVEATAPVTATGTVTATETVTGTATAANGAVSGNLAGTKWVLVSVGDKPVVETSIQPSLELSPSGAFRGFAGCNAFAGSYQLSNGTVSFQKPTIGTRACDQAGVTEQESAFMDALASATGFTFSGDTLTIQSSKGNLTFQRAQSASQQ